MEEKKKRFLELLSQITYAGNVFMVCHSMGISRAQVYVWRKNDANFAAQWDKAVNEGKETQIDEADQALRKAALEGNIKAIIFTLKRLDPETYGDRARRNVTVNDRLLPEQNTIESIKHLLKRMEGS